MLMEFFIYAFVTASIVIVVLAHVLLVAALLSHRRSSGGTRNEAEWGPAQAPQPARSVRTG
jgi:heme/copper-type cytochrome/quinol oxidase subunit 2